MVKLFLLVLLIFGVNCQYLWENKWENGKSDFPKSEMIIKNFPDLSKEDIHMEEGSNEWYQPTEGALIRKEPVLSFLKNYKLQKIATQFKLEKGRLYISLKLWDEKEGYGKLTIEDLHAIFYDPLKSKN